MTHENAPLPVESAAPLVSVENLSVTFRSPDKTVTVVNDVSFTLREGEALCLLGESGSGKTVTMRSLMRLLPPTAHYTGRIRLRGIDVLALKAGQLSGIRGSLVSMIFQEPMTALDPVFTIGQQIAETVRRHDGVSHAAARTRALDLLELVQIPSARRRLDAYPFELSGGLRQRAMIALALSCRPRILLADEPTTALDATVQIQVLLLLRSLQRELGMSTIFVTHDLGVACEVADRVAIMYAGRFVEHGAVDDVLTHAAHPYTEGLLHSTVHAERQGGRLEPIAGSPPDLAALPPGCSFEPRCVFARAACRAGMPPLSERGAGQLARCIRGSSIHEASAPVYDAEASL
ncbi:MAG: ABC transporter ATP-binding protein [Beijerinckiaceae bacterium]|jgi:peptide/nickel transport system ATP-binding protein|nr:ABC transporter ATP-binding protein [Beijerinckiaceae bacterium]